MDSEGASHAFGSREPFTVGVEEELFLVDPVSGRQANASEAVQSRIGSVRGTVELELHACQVELISEVCNTAAEAVAMLRQALAANSPFRHGRDTGLASSREVTTRGWPRSGVPRALRDFADFEQMAQTLASAAGVPDYTWFWWKMRPHPRLGTVEVRALDAQTSLAELERLSDLLHSGGGAGRQRAIFEIAGMDSLLRECAASTAASAEDG